MAKLVGTLGNDTLYGGLEANEIWGDYFKGFIGNQVGGNDRLFGSYLADTIIGDTADLAGQSRGGNDVIYGDPHRDAQPASTGSIHSVNSLTGLAGAGQLTPIPAGNTLFNSDDVLYGDALTMRESSAGGDDEIHGEAGNDRIYGDARDMFDHAIGGRDWIYGGTGADTIYGDASTMSGFAHGGNDHIEGGDFMTADSANTIYGDAWKMTDSARGGDDVIIGGSGNDVLFGDAWLMSGSSAGGNDFIYGGAGDDYLYGDAFGMAANTTGGNDTLCGSTGNDHMWGGRGADHFQFVEFGPANVAPFGPLGVPTNTGTDTIHDFNHNEGDKIELSMSLGFRHFSDVLITENGNQDAVIHLLDNSTVTLIGVHANQLAASDFLFV